ncbi:LuxR C-terminal-related transcriptional regulator [Serratia ureilytica]
MNSNDFEQCEEVLMEVYLRTPEDKMEIPRNYVETNDEEAFPGACWQVTIVDACYFGREGMKEAMHNHPAVVRVVAKETLTEVLSMLVAHPGMISPPSSLVLRLPKPAQEALQVLLQLGRCRMARFTRVVVVSNAALNIVRQALTHIEMCSSVRVIGPRCSLSMLYQTAIPTMSEIGNIDEVLYREPHNVLSQRERDVLSNTLHGMPIYMQARQARVSAKTIYSQRTRALLKLGVPDVLTLLRQFKPVF